MRKHFSLWVVIIIYLGVISAVFAVSLKLNRGDFVYALDDAYIHMSMAANFAASGHWATNQLSFAGASSSPLWVIMLSAVYTVFGKNTAAPLVFNILFQLLSIIMLYIIFRKYDVKKYIALFLLAFVFIIPMPALLFSGMEHSAQIAFMLLFVWVSIKVICSKEKTSPLTVLTLLLAAFLFSGIRYEDLILVSLLCLLLFLSGKRTLAIGAFLAGLIPLTVYGLISASHGWFFIPSTLLMKSAPPGFSALGIARYFSRAFSNITEPHIFVILTVIFVLYVINLNRQKYFWDKGQLFLFVSAVTIIVNMSIIDYNHNGAFYRYDAYLAALGILAIAINVSALLPEMLLLFRKINMKPLRYLTVVFLIILLSPLAVRVSSVFGVPEAMLEYHNQQYQMAHFCRLYAKDMNIALNDIGMVNYYTDNKVVDLLGLSDIDVARMRLNKTFSTEAIENLGKKENVRLVMCYESWFDEFGGLPPSWKKIAEWTMNDYNFFLGNSTVAIYAMNPEDEKYLKEKLIEFAPRLPKSISYKIFN